MMIIDPDAITGELDAPSPDVQMARIVAEVESRLDLDAMGAVRDREILDRQRLAVALQTLGDAM
jgi:hypothetical protein